MMAGWIAPLALLIATSTSPCTSRTREREVAPADTLIDVGGHRLHFRIWPGAGDITLVLESGGGSDLESWGSVPSRLASRTGRRVVAYDRDGLGRSDLGPENQTPADQIAHLGKALTALHVGKIVLFGHSYGGLLSLLHASRAPDRVVGLVLVDPMNPVFVDLVTLDWLQGTVPTFPSPKTPREIVVNRMKRTIGELLDQARAGIAAPVPTVVLTAGVPWWQTPAIDSAWRQSHERLVATPGVTRELIVARRSKHGISETEPELVADAGVRALELIEGKR